MRNLFLQLLRSGLFHLAAWVVTGFVGAVERLNSPRFDSWLHRNALALQAQGYEANAFDLFGTAPLFVLVVETAAAVLALGIFALIQMLLNKRLPRVLHRSVLLFAASFVIYTGYLAVTGLMENLTWHFTILAIQDLIWLAYLAFLVLNYRRMPRPPQVP